MQADVKYRSWEWWSILSQHSRGGSKCISALRPGQATKYVPSQPELHLKNKKENKQRKKKVCQSVAIAQDQILSQWFPVLTDFPASRRDVYLNQPFLVFRTIQPHVAPPSITDDFLCVGDGGREGKKVEGERQGRKEGRESERQGQ